MNPLNPSISELAPAEKLQLVEDLWDDLARTPAAIPVRSWHKEELALRKTRLADNPDSALTWDEAKHLIRTRRNAT